jgi:prophage tail gpP-like protein
MIELRKNGQKYSDWIEAEVSESIDNASSQGSFLTAKMIPDISTGDLVEIFVDGVSKLKGYIDDADLTSDAEELTQNFTARDKVADLLDSSLPDEAKKFKVGMTAENLVKRVVEALKMDSKIINNAGVIKPFATAERIVGESGASAFSFITDYLRKRSIFLNSDGAGNIVLYKLTSDIVAEFSFEKIINGNVNILRSSKRTNWSERYRYYVCKSQASSDSDFGDKGTVSRVGKAEDKEVRNTRYFEFVAEESMTNAECKERAEEEANIRRARSVEYTITVPEHSQNGVVFARGKGARVYDEAVGISGVLLIRSVKFRTSADQGNTTEIVMTYPDAYSVEANINQKAQKKIDFNKQPKSGGLL